MFAGFYRVICFCSYTFMVSSIYVVTDSRFDIVIVLDETSNWATNFIREKLFPKFKNIGQDSEQTRFGIAWCGFSRDDTVTKLNQCSNLKCLQKEAHEPEKENKYPYNYHDCLKVARNLFEPHKGDREDAANVVFVVTTGKDVKSNDFEDQVKDLVTLKNAAMFSLHPQDATKTDHWEQSLAILTKLAYNKKERVLNIEEVNIVEILRTTPGVGNVSFQDCEVSHVDLSCALINGSCKTVREFYVKVKPHIRGQQCPDPLPPTEYSACPKSECDCVKPEYFEEPDCPKKNCNRKLRVNISSNIRMPKDCTVTYTWVTCPYNCPTMDETEPTLIIILVFSVVLMVIVLTALALLVYRRQKRIAERGYDSTTFTLGTKTPSTSKVTTASGVVPVPVIDESEKSSRSTHSKRKPKPIKTYYHPESGKSVTKKTSVNVPLKESKSFGSPSSKVSSSVTKSPKSNITSIRKNGKTSSAIVPSQPSKTGSFKEKEVASVPGKKSGPMSPKSNVSKGSHGSPVSK